MPEYGFDTELVRLSLILGVVVGLFVYQRFGVTVGGAIVPGYLALFVTQPSHIVATLCLATATYFTVQKGFRPRLMLWGRRLFEYEIITALFLQMLWLAILFWVTPQVPELVLLYGIGFLLPGIIAHDMGRQGLTKTTAVTVIAAVAVFCLVIIVSGLRELLGLSGAVTANIPPMVSELAYDVDLLIIGVGLSVCVTVLLYRTWFFGSLRTGGFITAAYLALFVNRPLDLLFVAVSACITYLVVTKVLMSKAILFGRSKLAAMVLTGMLVAWSGELLLYYIFGYLPWPGFHAITPMIIALLANDAQRQGPTRTMIGTVIATTVVFLVLHWV